MSRKALKRILGDIGSGKDIIPLFLEARQSPSEVFWTLKSFLENPDKTLARKIAARHKVSPQYLYDRISDVVEKIDRFREANPYAVLNLTYHADAAAIQNSWKALLKEWHPDRQGGGEDGLLMAQKINDAYQTLKSPESRKAYDKQFAPFLAIAKDIEDNSTHFSPRGERHLALKVSLIGGILLVVALSYLWSIRSRQGSPPVRLANFAGGKKAGETGQAVRKREEPKKDIPKKQVTGVNVASSPVSKTPETSPKAPRPKREAKPATANPPRECPPPSPR
jgi:hypothetical protein